MRKDAIKETLRFYLPLLLESIVIGGITALFLFLLSLVTKVHGTFPLIALGLPLLALATAFCYRHWGRGSHRGNNLIIDSLHNASEVPPQMVPLALGFTVLSHLFGASVGREGTAVQLGGAVSHWLAKRFHLGERQKRLLVLSGVSAGFGAVFGTPFAGAFFGMELSEIGSFRKDGMLGCFAASFSADAVAKWLGAAHQRHGVGAMPPVSVTLLLAVILASLSFGLIGKGFSIAVHQVKGFYQKRIPRAGARAVLSALLLLAAIVLFHPFQYDGLSTWMIDAGFQGEAAWYDPLAKFLLTVLSLGAGFQGGEATPLFDIGAATGGLWARAFGLQSGLIAALGYVCVFGSAANIPLTTMALGIELFGFEPAPYFVLAALLSYYASGHNGIYAAQRIGTAKYPWLREHQGKTLEEIRPARASWTRWRAKERGCR
ncbi:MAG: chloride channel protein [Candidatus Limiplasma sp.]|nr:chloride channel protein [Candidatus Limiplasma sp.]